MIYPNSFHILFRYALVMMFNDKFIKNKSSSPSSRTKFEF